MAPATELANKLYSFIASGDIQQLLEYLSDDIVWTGNASSQDALSNIPFAGPFHGKEGVKKFFQALVDTVKTSRLEPYDWIDGGSKVAINFHCEEQGIATGKSIVHEAIHVMEFDETVTRLIKFTDYMDTAAYLYILTP